MAAAGLCWSCCFLGLCAAASSAAAPLCTWDGLAFLGAGSQDISSECPGAANIGGAFSVAFTVSVSTQAGTPKAFEFTPSGSDTADNLHISLSAGDLTFISTPGNSLSGGQVATGVLATNQLHRVLFTCSSTGVLKAYHMGTLIQEVATDTVLNAVARVLKVGSVGFLGTVEDLYLWNEEVGWDSAVIPYYPPDCVHAGKVFDGSAPEDITGSCGTNTFGSSLSVAFTGKVDTVDSVFPSFFSFKESAAANKLDFAVVTPAAASNAAVQMTVMQSAQSTDVLLATSTITLGEPYRFLVTMSSSGYMTLEWSGKAEVDDKNSVVPVNSVARTLEIGGSGFKGSVEDVYIFHRKVTWENAQVTTTTTTSVTSTTTATSVFSTTTASTTGIMSSTTTLETTATQSTSTAAEAASSVAATMAVETTTLMAVTTTALATTTPATDSPVPTTAISSAPSAPSTSPAAARADTSAGVSRTELGTGAPGQTATSTSMLDSTAAPDQTTFTAAAELSTAIALGTTATGTDATIAPGTTASTTTVATAPATTVATLSTTTTAAPGSAASTTTAVSASSAAAATTNSVAASSASAAASSSMGAWASPRPAALSSSEPASSPGAPSAGALSSGPATTTGTPSASLPSSSTSGAMSTPEAMRIQTTLMSGTSELATRTKPLAALTSTSTTPSAPTASRQEMVSVAASALGVTATARLSRMISGAGNGSAPVPGVLVVVLGTDVEVAVPRTLLSSISTRPGEEVFMVVSVLNDTGSFSSASLSHENAAEAVISIDLQGEGGRDVAVGGLADPIEFSMPVNYSSELTCAFWDENKKDWSRDGVSVSAKSVVGGRLFCLTTHLSVFAAIWQSFLLTLGCSQVSLLNGEALRAIFQGNWYTYLGFLALWTMMGIFLLMCGLAACLDKRQTFKSEFFLMPKDISPEERAQLRENRRSQDFAPEHMPRNHNVAAMASDFGPVASIASIASVATTSQATDVTTTKESGSKGCITMLVSIVNYTMGNSAVREAMQDIMDAWCKHLGCIQGVCEGVWKFSSIGPASLSTAAVSSTKMVLACRQALKSVAILSAQRQAAARLQMSGEMVTFILEDPDIYKVLVKYNEHVALAGEEQGVERTGDASWHKIHNEVTNTVLEELDNQPSRTVLGMTCALFRTNNPFSAVLIFDPFHDRKLRTFLFIVDQTLTVMVMSIFFEGSGERRKRLVGDCDNAAILEAPGAKIGRFAAIALVSALISTIPTFFLESLQTRGMKQVAYKGSVRWEKQLRVWKTQEKMIYVAGTLLFLGSLFFINLFLANSSREDHKNWLIGISLVLVQDWILLPFSTALALPLTCKVLLFALRIWGKAELPALLKEQRVRFFQKSNAMLPLMAV